MLHTQQIPCTDSRRQEALAASVYCPVMSDFCNPMDCSLLGSSVREILPARTLEWVAIPLSRGSS